MASTKLSFENTERFSLKELLFIDFESRTRLLVYIIGLLIFLFLNHIDTAFALLVLKDFLLNQFKSSSRELLIIGIILA